VSIDAQSTQPNAKPADGQPQPGVKPTPPEVFKRYGFTLQPVTASLDAALQLIESPIFAIIRTARANPRKTIAELTALVEKEIKPDPGAGIETVFLFATPIREARKLINEGREVFRARAMEVIGEALHPMHLAQLERACAEFYALSFTSFKDGGKT
jgi:hypothetical protein